MLENEWVEDGLATRFEYPQSKIREFLAPASVVNSYGPPIAIEAHALVDILDAIDEEIEARLRLW